MRMKKIVSNIPKWILLLAMSSVSATEVFKFRDLNTGEVVPKKLNRRVEHNRRGQDLHGYKYKKLVKRIIPHSYETKDLEYDSKFNTVFKPLLRLHKKNPTIEYSSGEEPIDLVYVIDDKQFDDAANLDKDDTLLKPFSTNGVQLEYLPREYILNNGIKVSNINTPTMNTFDLIDDRKPIQDKKNQYEFDSHAFDEFPENDQNIYESKDGDSLDYGNDPIKAELNQMLHKKAPYVIFLQDRAKRAVKSRKKPLKAKPNINKLKKVVNKQLKAILSKSHPVKPKPKPAAKVENDKEALLFGPVGGIISKQYDRETVESIIQKPLLAKQELRYFQAIKDPNILPEALKSILQKQRDNESDNDRSTSHEVDRLEKIKSMFVGVGHINSKQITLQERQRHNNLKPGHIQLHRDKKVIPTEFTNKNKLEYQNKLALVKKLAKYAATKLEKDRKEKQRAQDELRTLTHIKSGEEEEVIQMIKKHLDDDDITTKEPVTWRPNYPFWNYWTYDKQIELDDCKGQLIQHGRICVSAWSRK